MCKRHPSLLFFILLATLVCLGCTPAAAGMEATPRSDGRRRNRKSGKDARLTPDRPFSVFGYLPEYRQAADFPYENFFSQGLTHLIFFSLEVDPVSLRLSHAETRLPPLTPPLTTATEGETTSAGPSWWEIRDLAYQYGVRLVVCVGGGGRSAGFASLVQSAQARRAFLEQLNALVLERELDGVDFNWEYPATPEQWDGLSALLLEAGSVLGYARLPRERQHITPDANSTEGIALRRALVLGDLWHRKRAGLLRGGGAEAQQQVRTRVRPVALSMAFHPAAGLGDVLRRHRLLASLRYVHLMAYDYRPAGPRKALTYEQRHHSSDDFARYALSSAVVGGALRSPSLASTGGGGSGSSRSHRRRLTLGVPLYGVHVGEGAEGPETYERIQYFMRQYVRAKRQDWWEAAAAGNLTEWRSEDFFMSYGYVGYDSVQRRLRLARKQGAAGVMLWELGQDMRPLLFRDGETSDMALNSSLSLVDAIGEELRRWDSEAEEESDKLKAVRVGRYAAVKTPMPWVPVLRSALAERTTKEASMQNRTLSSTNAIPTRAATAGEEDEEEEAERDDVGGAADL